MPPRRPPPAPPRSPAGPHHPPAGSHHPPPGPHHPPPGPHHPPPGSHHPPPGPHQPLPQPAPRRRFWKAGPWRPRFPSAECSWRVEILWIPFIILIVIGVLAVSTGCTGSTCDTYDGAFVFGIILLFFFLGMVISRQMQQRDIEIRTTAFPASRPHPNPPLIIAEAHVVEDSKGHAGVYVPPEPSAPAATKCEKGDSPA